MSVTVLTPDSTSVLDDANDSGAESELVVDLLDVHKRFDDRVILDGIDLQIRRGEFVALLGASGSGKTTLLRILASLDRANDGSLRVSPHRSVVFQDARLLPFQRVLGNILLGTDLGRNAARAVAEKLEEVGLPGYERRWPKNLSGGEAQRVALARALVREPRLLLLDEPFAALDALTRIRMHELVLEIWRRHDPAVLFITHDVDEAILLADRILVLRDGGFITDLRVDVPREERRRWRGFDDARAQLLENLGVVGGLDERGDATRHHP